MFLYITINREPIACIPESNCNFVKMRDDKGNEFAAVVPFPGMVIPLTGAPGICAHWRQEAAPIGDMPSFGTPTGNVIRPPNLFRGNN